MIKLWTLYFLPIYLFTDDEFRVGAWEMFLSQLNVLHWCSPVSSVGKDDWNHGKVGPNPRLKSIEHILPAKHILHS